MSGPIMLKLLSRYFMLRGILRSLRGSHPPGTSKARAGSASVGGRAGARSFPCTHAAFDGSAVTLEHWPAGVGLHLHRAVIPQLDHVEVFAAGHGQLPANVLQTP